MVILDDIKIRYKSLDKLYADCYGAFDVQKMRGRLAELTNFQNDPDLYKNPKEAQKPVRYYPKKVIFRKTKKSAQKTKLFLKKCKVLGF